MMRIVMVGGFLNGETGDINMIKNLSKELSRTNEVFLIPILPLFHSNIIIEDVNVIPKCLSFRIFLKSFLSSLHWLKIVFKFLKIKKIRGLAYYFITLYYLSIIEGEIKFNNLQPDVIHVHGISIELLPFILFAHKSDIPLLVTIHLYSVDSIPSYYNKNVENHIINFCLKNQIMLSTVSESTRNNIIKVAEDQDRNTSDIHVIMNGVNTNKFNIVRDVKKERVRLGLGENKIILLQVGTLSKRKNHIAVLKALLELNELKDEILYIIIGDGPEKDNLVNFCNKYNLDSNVIFKGKVPNDEVNVWYSLSDFFILPSFSEGLPLVFMEAISSGLPVITFRDLEGVSNIYHKDCFELINERSTSEIAISIKNAINKNWDKNKIRKHSLELDWTNVANNYLNLYKKLLR